MPTETVIRQSELAAFITNTLDNIRKGCADARAKGMIVELPADVQMTVTLIADDGWQALEIQGGQNTDTIEELGGGSKEVTTGTDNGTTENKSKQTRSESSDSTKTNNFTVSDTHSDSTTVTSNGTSSGSEKSTQQGQNNNAHNQTGQTSYAYEQ